MLLFQHIANAWRVPLSTLRNSNLTNLSTIYWLTFVFVILSTQHLKDSIKSS